jgi:hypothetical protein
LLEKFAKQDMLGWDEEVFSQERDVHEPVIEDMQRKIIKTTC